MLIKNSTKITLYTLLVFNAVMCITLTAQISRLITAIQTAVVYDIDLVRDTFIEETQFMYFEGCRRGTEYVRTEPVTGFDPNSPTNYCNDKRESWQDYILEQARKLGKRR